MRGIPGDLFKQLYETLSECGPFDDNKELAAVFVDTRIHVWRDRLPQRDSRASRIEATIHFLHNRYHPATNKNALVLLLQVLQARISSRNTCYQRLAELATLLETEIERSRDALPGGASTFLPPQERYDVFLSYNEADQTVVDRLAARLQQEAGIVPFFDRWHLIPGDPWQEEIEAALERSAAIAVFAGPSGVNPWQHEEMRAGLDRAVRSRNDVRILPVLLPGADEASLPSFVRSRMGPGLRTGVDFRLGLDDERAFARLVAGVRGKPPPVDGQPAAPTAPRPSPYRGLLPFQLAQQHLFFGRSEESARLWQRVQAHPFTAVVGASGSGKSSLVLAGLLPQLPADWQVLQLVPGHRPLRALAEQLTRLAPGSSLLDLADTLTERLHSRTDGLSTTISTLLADQEAVTTVLLFVDQFEELFTLLPDAARQQQFVANLVDAVQTSRDIRLVITLRADFFQYCLAFPPLLSLLEMNQLLLGPLSEAGLREAIVQPAYSQGVLFEDGLVARIVDALGEDRSLPLLQVALDQLWQTEVGTWLTHDGYEAIGRVQGAIEKQAEQVYAQLSEAERARLPQLFVRLVTLVEDGTTGEVLYVRRRMRRTADLPESLITRLSQQQSRLLTADQTTVTLAHEALITGWQRLQVWLAANQAQIRWRQQLEQDVRLWQQHEQNKSYVYSQAQLTQVQQYLPPDSLNEGERAFLAASIKQERVNRLKRGGVVVLALLVLLTSSLLLRNWWEGRIYQLVPGFPADFPTDLLAVPEAAGMTLYAGLESSGVARLQPDGTWITNSRGLPLAVPDDPEASIVGVHRITADVCQPERLFASLLFAGIYRLDNFEGAWQPAWEGLPADTFVALALAASGDHLFAADYLSDEQLYVSHDGGESWQFVGEAVQAVLEEVYMLYAPPCETADFIYVGAKTGLYRLPLTDSEPELVPDSPTWVRFMVPAADGVSFYVLTDDETADIVELCRWQPDGPFTCRSLWAVTDPPLALAAHPLQSGLVYILLEDGTIYGVPEGEPPQSLAKPFGVYQVNKLLAVPHPQTNQTWLLVGHNSGLLEYTGSLD